MSKIGLLIIATNKYTRFIQPLIESADNYLLKDQDVTYFIFTDKELNIKSRRNIEYIKVEHEPWPWMTLGRYNIFFDNRKYLENMNYLYYCDADMLFFSDVGEEIICDRVATVHPGFIGTRGTPETNKKSLACVNENEPMIYFAGGFNGGSKNEYLKMASVLSKNILEDYRNGIIAIWHDESHMNRYFIDNPPSKILDPSYCYPESWNLPFEKRLLALDKNHDEVRS